MTVNLCIVCDLYDAFSIFLSSCIILISTVVFMVV